VMACNMSSAVALDVARSECPSIPIIGVIEPGAKAAAKVSGGAPVGVLATTGTVNSGAYSLAIKRIDPSIIVVQQACPKFVPIVESGNADSEEAEAAACTYAAPLLEAGCKTIVLGCTHYPFLRRAIECVAGSDVKIVDPAEETAQTLLSILMEGRLCSEGRTEDHAFFASGSTDDFAAIGGAFLGNRIECVKHVSWSNGQLTMAPSHCKSSS